MLLRAWGENDCPFPKRIDWESKGSCSKPTALSDGWVTSCCTNGCCVISEGLLSAKTWDAEVVDSERSVGVGSDVTAFGPVCVVNEGPAASVAPGAGRFPKSASISFRVLFLFLPSGHVHSNLNRSQLLHVGLSPEHLAFLARQGMHAKRTLGNESKMISHCVALQA